MHSKLSFAHRG